MIFHTKLIISLFSCIFLNFVQSGDQDYSRNGKCWNMTIDTDWNKPGILDKYQRQYVKQLWKNKSLVVTRTLQELKQTMFLMIGSDSKFFRDTAFAHAVRMTAILINPIGSVPVCQYTSIVNASVDMVASRYKKSGKDALANLANSIGSMFSMIGHASMVKAECDNMSDVQQVSEDCFGGGLVYPIESILSNHIRIFPGELKEILLKLYQSNVFIEQINGLILASSLTEYGQDLLHMHEPGPLFESLQIYTQSFNTECCDLIKRRLEELNDFHSRHAKSNSEAVVKSKYTKQDGYGFKYRLNGY